MAYSRAIVQRAEARLQSEKEQNERSSRARIAAIYEKEPRLGEIERELRRTAAHVLAATFRRQGDPVAAMQQLKKENLALQQERDWILQAEGLGAGRSDCPAHLPDMRRDRLCGRGHVRMPQGALPPGAEEGADESVRRREL